MDRNKFIEYLFNLWYDLGNTVQIKLEPIYANQIKLEFANNNKNYIFFIPTDYQNGYESLNYIDLCVRDPSNASAKMSFYLNRIVNKNKDFD